MGKALDLTGKKFNRLTAIKRVGTSVDKKAIWSFRCDCGEITEIIGKVVKSGATKSCGCLQKERASESNTTHGMRSAPVYKRWLTLRDRCSNPNTSCYKYYGGKGIKVCDRWNDFSNFYDDIGQYCTSGLTIDRIDNEKGYCKENCRLANWTTQANNKSSTKRYLYKGYYGSLKQICDKFKLNYNMISQRIGVYGYTFEDAITKKKWVRQIIFST